jgi:hypothetical protein
VSPEAFEKLTVARAKDILSRYPDFYPMSYLLSSPGGNGSQATYLFETKLGFMGLINILHVREDLSSISFQYKLASETMKGGDAAK